MKIYKRYFDILGDEAKLMLELFSYGLIRT